MHSEWAERTWYRFWTLILLLILWEIRLLPVCVIGSQRSCNEFNRHLSNRRDTFRVAIVLLCFVVSVLCWIDRLISFQLHYDVYILRTLVKKLSSWGITPQKSLSLLYIHRKKPSRYHKLSMIVIWYNIKKPNPKETSASEHLPIRRQSSSESFLQENGLDMLANQGRKDYLQRSSYVAV